MHLKYLRTTVVFLVWALVFGVVPPESAAADRAAPAAVPAAQQQPGGDVSPVVTLTERVGSSLPLRNQPAMEARSFFTEEKLNFQGSRPAVEVLSNTPNGDAALQTAAPSLAAPAVGVSFAGLPNLSGYLPPDTVGEVGPNHFVQMVNVSFAIYSKSGQLLAGPFEFIDLFQSFGGPCATSNDGDPIVVYDQIADRWVLSQFSLPNSTSTTLVGPFYECVAVSQTGDPTGAYYLYEFKISDTKMNDYPKLGVWPDGYYMSINQFSSGTSAAAGQGVVAFERDKMLVGLPARMVYFDLQYTQPSLFAMLVADLDGARLPPAGAPIPFILHQDNYPDDLLSLWNFHVDWANPANSTFTKAVDLSVAAFDSNLCYYSRNCIPQPGGRSLDALADPMMFRLQYRNFGTHQSLAANHTVDVNEADRAGIRWYELRKTSGDWGVYQQGTYSPNDGHHRWLGSAAINGQGDLALGYSISSRSLSPSIRATGRLAEDTLGQLTFDEAILVAGSGYQTHSSGRWGDYADLTIDPRDDCTFWFTTEYTDSVSLAGWKTRISSFRLRNCINGQKAILQGAVTNADTDAPISGALVEALQGGELVASTVTANDGWYSLLLDPGTYDLRISSFGYITASSAGVSLAAEEVLTRDFQLDVAAMYTVSGVVRDARTGWSLYARLDINGYPYNPVWTNPVTGAYSVELPGGLEMPVSASAFIPGYLVANQVIGPLVGATSVDIALTPEPAGGVPAGGGLVVGTVSDGNTDSGLVDAVVSAGTGSSAITQATPLDPNVNDGLYWLFLPEGSRLLQATRAGYIAQALQTDVLAGQTVGRDFSLAAPRLSYQPATVNLTLQSGEAKDETLTLENTGNASAQFNLVKTAIVESGDQLLEPPNYAVKPFRLHEATAENVSLPELPDAGLYPIGAVSTLSPGQAAQFYGLAVDGAGGRLWLSSPGAAWGGDDRLMEFDLEGAASSQFYPYTLTHTFGPADAAYNPHTHSVWVVGAGDIGCIQELESAIGETGRAICPEVVGDVLRGLAYDPVAATWFSGGWGNGMVYRFGYDGELISRVNTGLPIAGLAYHAETQRLFVMTSALGSPVYVLDVAHQYALLGKFSISGFSSFGGAGLDLDSDNRLWALDQKANQVYQVDHVVVADPEIQSPAVADWLTISPLQGTLAPGASTVIQLTLNAFGVSPGVYHAGVLVSYTGPYPIATLPVNLTVVVMTNFPFRVRLPFIIR